ncbi:AzlC family ABC transporter permease [Caenimonas sp. SL110]|uniref:AzlC family ABC transporter permease n=1 Tax=Caenimonas sp. SL110 TaxID=1450524 RepID=UPI00069D5164|nr:AzlC family ABC transporter permease [Caenimonas sp. SL110]
MSSTPATSFTLAGVRRGFVAAQPLAPGVVVYGIVFGVLASERGLSWLQAMLMSAFVYSGSAQLAALQGWTGATLITPLIATVLVINARYVLYGAAIQPWLQGASRTQAYASLFVLGDGNWALSMREFHAGYRDAGFVFGTGIAMFAPWLLGTLGGHLMGHSVPDPAVLGLDFMLVAFAAAIGIAMWRGSGDLWPAAAAAAVALALHRWIPGGWYIVGAGIAAGIVGAMRYEKHGKSHGR